MPAAMVVSSSVSAVHCSAATCPGAQQPLEVAIEAGKHGPMPRAAPLDGAHAGALDGDRHRLAREGTPAVGRQVFACGLSGLIFSMKRSCTSGPVLVKPQASVSLRPSTTSGTPASVAPTTLAAAVPGRSSARWARYQIAGAREPQVRIVGQQRFAGARARARDDPVVGGAAADHVVDGGGATPAGGRRSGAAADRAGPARAAAAERSMSSRGIRSSISADVRPCAASASRVISWLRLVLRFSAIILPTTRLSARRHGSGSWRSSRNSGGKPRLEQPGVARR